MKILLIRPQQIHWSNEEKRLAQPLGLLYLTGALRSAGHEVGLVDAALEGYDNEGKIKRNLFEYGLTDRALEKRIEEFSPDAVGIESNFTYFWGQAKKVASLVKKIDKKIITVIGGHHVAGVEQEILQQNKDIDHIVGGESELKFLELLNRIANKSLNINYKKFQTLDELPDPAFDLLNPAKYNSRMSTYIKPKSDNFFVYLSQRGCGIDCDFCTTPEFFGRKTRLMPIQRVRSHIEKIKEMGFKEIVFEDDNFLLMPTKYRKEYLGIPKELGLPAFQDAGLYYPKVKRQHIEELAEAGIYGIFLPVENPNISTMNKYNKYRGMPQKQARRKIKQITKWLNDAGIVFYCGTMCGFPGEGKKDLELAVDFAGFLKECGAIGVTFNWFHPYPGTRVYNRYYDLIPLKRKWQTYPEFWNFIKPVIPLKDISLEEADAYIDEKFFEINGTHSRSPSYHFKAGC